MEIDPSAAFVLLRLSTRLVESVQAAMAAEGFGDLRPVHGFAFVRLSRGPTSTVELAAYLGMTKQSASQLVEQLVAYGYLRREDDAHDGRIRRLVLTDRGWAATRTADRAAAGMLGDWRRELGSNLYQNWESALRTLSDGGPIRPHG